MIFIGMPFAVFLGGLMWIFRAVHRAVNEELENEEKNIRTRLSDLYRQLEQGEITEEQFGEEEKRLLDRLDELKKE